LKTHLVQIELGCLPAVPPDMGLGFRSSLSQFGAPSAGSGSKSGRGTFGLVQRLSRVTNALVAHSSILMGIMVCHAGEARDDNPAIMR